MGMRIYNNRLWLSSGGGGGVCWHREPDGTYKQGGFMLGGNIAAKTCTSCDVAELIAKDGAADTGLALLEQLGWNDVIEALKSSPPKSLLH
ncbi:MAG: hypothetical protein K2Q32_01785 [Alphaproteobacteria bacterium]|nr:hypothetical protein [Alphaproteobacteria bacterium]